MTVDSAVCKDCGKIRIPLYPVGRDSPYPNSSCTGEGKAVKRRDPSEKAGWLGPWMRTVTRLSFVMLIITGRGRSQAGVQHGASGHHASATRASAKPATTAPANSPSNSPGYGSDI